MNASNFADVRNLETACDESEVIALAHETRGSALIAKANMSGQDVAFLLGRAIAAAAVPFPR